MPLTELCLCRSPLIHMRVCVCHHTTTARFRGFISSIWLDDGSPKFSATYERLWAGDDATPADDEAAAACATGVGGRRIR